MKSSASKIQMTSYDELFKADGAPNSRGEMVQEIALSDLFPFKNHPFKVLDDEAMQDTAESIGKYGVLVPGIARPRTDGAGNPCGGYELIAGHRRKHGSELVGKTTMPVLVRDLDEDEATIIMVDSNIQRENLLPSEKAWAYKMKLDAIKRKAGRPTINSAQVGQNLKGQVSVEIVAEEAGESRNQVKRYIRLTELLPELLQLVDDKKLPFNPGVELSYLSQEGQGWLLAAMGRLEVSPSLAQAGRLKKYSQDGTLTETVIDAILTEEHPESVQVTIKKDKLTHYFPKTYTPKQMEEIIFSLLETWKTQNE